MAGKSKYKIEVCVLQNGVPIAETTCFNNKNKVLRMSSSRKDELSLPHYPLPVGLELIKIKNSKIQLILNEPWQGYLKSNGRIVHLKGADRSYRVFPMIGHDLTNVVLGDLRVMIKVLPILPEKKVKIDPTYRSSISGLVFQNTHEKFSFLIGLLASVTLFIILSIFVKYTEAKRPKVFEELEDIYTLPFVHENSFITAPEALQGYLNRDQLLASIAGYYRSISSLFMGWEIHRPEMVFDTSKEWYRQVYEEYNHRIDEKINKQNEINESQHQEFGNYILSIPSVYGESFQEKLLRVIGKVNSLHESYELSLEMRRKITKEFRADPEYDWGTYLEEESSELDKLGAKENAEHVGQINLFKRKTDEEQMYEEVLAVGKKAKLRRKYLMLRSHNKAKLEAKTIKKVYIPENLRYISFVQPEEFGDHADKSIKELRALSKGNFGKIVKVKEPLVGKIDLRQVKNVIKSKRFQLNLCYELALRRNQKLRGSMFWSWQIDTLGKISEISLSKTSLKDREMINCIHQKLATWKFPRPNKGSVEINHRFDFEPQDG